MAVVLKSDSQTSAGKTSAARDVTGLAGFNLADLADEGRARLLECRQQIVAMKAEAAAECKAIKEAAEKEGYEKGTKRAEEDFDQRLRAEADKLAKAEIASIKAAAQRMQQTYNSWMSDFAETLNSIALSSAERLIQKQLGEDQEIFLRWADEALRSTRSAQQLTLAVHPETIADLGKRLDELLASPDLPEQTHVVPDESVAIGEITVRQAGGEIQAGMRSQLARLAEMLG